MLRGVDAAAALAVPGVETALTGRDLEGVIAPIQARLEAPGFAATPWPALPTDRVRFVGEPVAVVAAVTPYAAVDGCARIAVEYDPLPAVLDVDRARDPGAARLHPQHGSNVLFSRRGRQGDVDAAFAAAAHVVRETFSHDRCSAAPLEPRGLIAHWVGDALTLWLGVQTPSLIRTGVARAFGMPEARVRVVVPDTGGGFGQKMYVMPEDLAVAAVRFKSGALGVVHATTSAYPGFAERIELTGTEGTALLEGTSLQMKFQDGTSFEMKTESGGGGTGADPMAFPHDWHRGVLEDFLDAIEKNREPRVSGTEALKVHRFIDRILQSAG